jgi:hypothetical protein
MAKEKMGLLVNMIKSAMHAYQEDLILTLFHRKSLLHLWGNFSFWRHVCLEAVFWGQMNILGSLYSPPKFLLCTHLLGLIEYGSCNYSYMVQLLNLVAQNLAAPVLHNTGFAVSTNLPFI